MNIILTEEQKEKFDNMTKEEQDAYLEGMELKLEKLSIKSAILVTLLIENLDDLAQFNMYRQGLKKKGNMFQKELESYLDTLFKTKKLSTDGEERKQTADFIYHATKAADGDLDKLLNILVGIEKQEENAE